MSRRRSLSSASDNTEINMSPLIDMVFILLIFFIVTTTFVEEVGINVEKPTPDNKPMVDDPARPVVFVVNRNREVIHEGVSVGLNQVRAIVANARAKKDVPVIVEATTDAPAGVMVGVADEAYAAGAPVVSIQRAR